MKYPQQINSDFFELLLSAGWFQERDIILEKLPSHLEELPLDVKKFLRELWFISFAKKFFYLKNDIDDYHFGTVIYSFGETTETLKNYANPTEYTQLYTNLVDCKIRNFGFRDFRELLIDEYGRIYYLPDSGDLYVFKGRFYQALYHVIYQPKQAYLIGDNFELFDDSQGSLGKTGLYLKDI